MLVRRGEHTDLEAPAKADPADSVVTPDYYTQLPQIRLTGNPAGRATQPATLRRPEGARLTIVRRQPIRTVG